MFSLDSYTNQELVAILNADKLNDLYDTLAENKINPLEQIIDISPPKPIPNKILQALIIPITDTSTYPLILLWSIVGIISVGTMPLLITTGIVLLTSIAICSFFFYANYVSLLNKEIELNQKILFTQLKNEASDLFLFRKGYAFTVLDSPIYNPTNKLSSIAESVRVALLFTMSLFGSYFLGLYEILNALNVVSAIPFSGPAGLLLGLAITLPIGIFCGFQNYDTMQEEDKSLFEQNSAEVLLTKKIAICNQLDASGPDIALIDQRQATKPINTPVRSTLNQHHHFQVSRLKFFAPEPKPTATIDAKLDLAPCQ